MNPLNTAMGKMLSRKSTHQNDPVANGQYKEEYTTITAVAYNGDHTLLTATGKGTVNVYNVENKQKQNAHIVHEREITQIHATGDGMFTSSRDATIRFTRLDNPGLQSKCEGHKLVVTAFDLNADGSQLVSGSRDNSVRLWDTQTNATLRTNSIPRNLVTDIKWDVENNMIFQCGEDKVLKILDTRSLHIVSNFPARQYFQTCLDVNGTLVLTGSVGCNGAGNELVLWDVRQLKSIHCFPNAHREKINACRFVKHNTRAITISRDSSVKLWTSTLDNECLDESLIGTAKDLTSLAINQSQTSFAVGTMEYGTHLYSMLPNHKMNPDAVI